MTLFEPDDSVEDFSHLSVFVLCVFGLCVFGLCMFVLCVFGCVRVYAVCVRQGGASACHY